MADTLVRRLVGAAMLDAATTRKLKPVLKLEDRSVRLQFTLGGEPTPPAPANNCLRGQALITLRLRLAVTPNP
jgi:hypothetical protein